MFFFTVGADPEELHFAAVDAKTIALRARRNGGKIGEEYVAHLPADAAPAVRMRRERVIVPHIAAGERDAAHLPVLGKPAQDAEHRPPRNRGILGMHAFIDLRRRRMIEARECVVYHLFLSGIAQSAHILLLNKTYS